MSSNDASAMSPKAAKKGGYFATVPPQEILPIVDSRYQSSVPGIYVIGDVTGLPLVKVAANQGVEVIEKMEAAGVFEGTDQDNDGRLDLVIIGAGPAGISAAMEAQQRGLRYVVLERNKIASTVRSFPPGKKVYAEPQFIRNESKLLFDEDLDKDEFLLRVNQLVSEKQLHIKEETEVKRVRKNGHRQFEVETVGGKSFPAKEVLVAVGRQGQPRLLECPGADDANKVTYRLHSPDDYDNNDILVVGGGNSAIEAALLMMANNRVTLSYRGDEFYRAKEENRQLIETAAAEGRIKIIYNSNLTEVRDREVDLDVNGKTETLKNDYVIVQIGTLPPVDFLMDMGLELDGIWTPKRGMLAIVGLIVGWMVYFYAKLFTFLPTKAGTISDPAAPDQQIIGKLLVPGMQGLADSALLSGLTMIGSSLLPMAWLVLLALTLINRNMVARGHEPFLRIPYASAMLFFGGLLFMFVMAGPSTLTLTPALAGEGPYYIPGLAWAFNAIPRSGYFSNVYGFYYLLYFSLIAVFGIYWAAKSGHHMVWRRNLTIIASQWTLWWGIPTFLAVFIGRNPWTPLLTRSLNAWPLNMGAFNVDPVVGPGDPAWWNTVAVVGVVWAVLLTFVIIPLMTIKWGKIYCSYICSCGGLAETVGNGFRHRGPKGDQPRKWEKLGFVFIVLATIATIANLTGLDRYLTETLPAQNSTFASVVNWFGFEGLLSSYNYWVGTALAGAIAIGLYPFLGQRIWCRMWCPLAFWMNFWGRWSNFKITPEKGKCIDCNVCNQYCQMGIDIKSRALQGRPVTLVDSPCVGCNECIVRCPMEILHLGDVPKSKQSLPVVTSS